MLTFICSSLSNVDLNLLWDVIILPWQSPILSFVLGLTIYYSDGGELCIDNLCETVIAL